MIKNYISHLSAETLKLVEDAFEQLCGAKPRFGLPFPVKHFEEARQGTFWGGKKIHYWLTIGGHRIGLRIFEHHSRPKRRVLRDQLSISEPPALFVYAKMRIDTVVCKLAQCIKTGLNRLRRGLIDCLRMPRKHGTIERCDGGNNLSLSCGFRTAYI